MEPLSVAASENTQATHLFVEKSTAKSLEQGMKVAKS